MFKQTASVVILIAIIMGLVAIVVQNITNKPTPLSLQETLFKKNDQPAILPSVTPTTQASDSAKTDSNLAELNSPSVTPSPVPTIIKKETMSQKTYDKPPALQLKENIKYQAVLHTTAGDIRVELNAETTPLTVNNFVFLAKEKFYDNTIFHRTLDGFMIQGGDPEGTGQGGPGYRFADEPFEGDYTRGTIAMANAGPNTNGSQFFIMHKDYGLPKNYVIFGKAVEGLEVVDAIATAETEMNEAGEKSKPVNPVSIKSIEIVEKSI